MLTTKQITKLVKYVRLALNNSSHEEADVALSMFLKATKNITWRRELGKILSKDEMKSLDSMIASHTVKGMKLNKTELHEDEKVEVYVEPEYEPRTVKKMTLSEIIKHFNLDVTPQAARRRLRKEFGTGNEWVWTTEQIEEMFIVKIIKGEK